jgi:hypothetical protein
LGNQRKCGIQSDIGSAYYIGLVVDMQKPWRNNRFRPSDIADDKNNSSFQRLYLGIMYEQTGPAKNRFASTPSGGVLMIKPDSSIFH